MYTASFQKIFMKTTLTAFKNIQNKDNVTLDIFSKFCLRQ